MANSTSSLVCVRLMQLYSTIEGSEIRRLLPVEVGSSSTFIPLFTRGLYIPNNAGFLPSPVGHGMNKKTHCFGVSETKQTKKQHIELGGSGEWMCFQKTGMLL